MTFHTPFSAAPAMLAPRSRRGLAALALAALLGVPGMALAQQAAATTGQVFTADEHGNSVSRVDLASGEVTTVPLPVTPHNVQVTPDMKQLLLVGSPVEAGHGDGGGHGDSANAGRLLVLDPLALDAAPVEIEIGSHPAHVVTDREGKRAFASNAGDDTISVVDLATRAVTPIPAGDYPHGLRLSPDGRYLLVANVEGGDVSLFDTATLAEAARIPVGAAPVQVAFLPDGSRAYVSLRDEDAVAVIDLATREVTARIPVGDGPIQLYATPDGGNVAGKNDHGRVGSHRYLTCVPEPETATADFLWFYLQSPEGLAAVQAASPGSADRNRTLAVKRLEAIEVPVPPLESQRSFDRLQAKARQIRDIRAASARDAAALIPALLHQVFGAGDRAA